MKSFLVKSIVVSALLIFICGCEKDESASTKNVSSYKDSLEQLKIACRKDEPLYKKDFISTVATDRNVALDKIRVCEPNFLDDELKKLIAKASIDRYSEVILSKKASDSDKLVAIDLLEKYDPSFREKYKNLRALLEKKRAEKQKREVQQRVENELRLFKLSSSLADSPKHSQSESGRDDKVSRIARECLAQAGVPIEVPDYKISQAQLDAITNCAARKIQSN